MSTPIIGRGTQIDPRALPLYTRDRRFIENEQRLEDHPSVLVAKRELDKQTNPGAMFRRSSGTYNCMGMLFASRRTCVDINQLDLVLEHDGYRKLGSSAQAKVGDLVVYRNALGTRTHVGQITEINIEAEKSSGAQATLAVLIQVISKWGEHGEYLHAEGDVSAWIGKPSEYWSDRSEYDASA